MRTYFVKGEVSENRAVGNVMVVNYPLEKDSTIIYQNYVETAEARMFMKDRKLKKYGLRHRMASSTPSVWRLPNVPDSRDLPGSTTYAPFRPTMCSNGAAKRPERL